MLICAIDPGVTGAIAYYSDGALNVFDMPSEKTTVNRKVRNRVNAKGLFFLLKAFHQDDAIYILEQVHGGVFGQRRLEGGASGAASAFAFGEVYGLIKMAITGLGAKPVLVQPGTWKSIMRVPKDANGIFERTIELFPGQERLFQGARGGIKHDRCEAAILAAYGARVHAKP